MWNRPCQGSMPTRPFSEDGQLPSDIAAIRYCDSTMRRSSSFQRGSLLPERSMAPPLFQKVSQRTALAVLVSGSEGRAGGRAVGGNGQADGSGFGPRGRYCPDIMGLLRHL